MTKKYRNLLSAELNCSEEKKIEIIDSLDKISKLFTVDMLDWLAGLFEPRIGGFYYSNSSRDNEGFLPDIESTHQAIQILFQTGAITSYNDIPEWIRSKIIFFICSIEDPNNGLFYHPQWQKSHISAHKSRLSRDFSAAKFLSHKMGFELPYISETIVEKNTSVAGVFEHLSSEETFLSYLERQPFNIRTMSTLCAQNDFIKSRGLDKTVCSWLLSKQDKGTGLFTPPNDPEVIEIFHAATDLFTVAKMYMPNSHKAVPYIMDIMSDKSVCDITVVSNFWRMLRLLMNNIKQFVGKDSVGMLEIINNEIANQAIPVLMNTMKVLALSRKPDGSFSYNLYESSAASQGMPVAVPHTFEGDVNATYLALTILHRAFQVLGSAEPYTGPLNKSDFITFLDKVNNIK